MKPLVQFGTMQMLVERLLDGFVSAKEMLESGNTGIGTGAGVDGELIMLDGVAYQVDVQGHVNRVADDFPIAFGDVHQADFKPFKHFENITLEDLSKEILKEVGTKNYFFAVKMTGEFAAVETRAAAKSEKPYPGLGAIAKTQRIFDRNDVKGTMVGYFTPHVYEGVGVAGFHQHFLSDELDFGGHVLGATLKSVDVELQLLSGLTINLPMDNEDYKNADLTDLSTLNDVIHAAESAD
ncbi:acetolactate decarboxylase [Fructobacillus durionis]|uniref:Alpha-acetolactate decarboxylase n=1 Tax=Fructobacillus durionis TaxID=283737 RepID=A0A1I1EI19_9LACO|nr:acetolactate decarboxylase [Fructobacillus durionis]SFB86789.1 acetolactate decarboxylase [Fructobacillus durionis]